MGELQIGKGLNQKLGLPRPHNTCWGSHFKTFMNLIVMLAPIVYAFNALAMEEIMIKMLEVKMF